MIIFVSDSFAEQYVGGAELTTEAIIDEALFPVNKVISAQVTVEMMKKFQDSFWIFGNFANLSETCILHAAKNLDYSVIEYDYKFCKFRSVIKHEKFEDKCECHTGTHGKLVAAFLAKSKMNFWMSKKQHDYYTDFFPIIKNNTILSSVFSADTISYLKSLNTENKNDKWIILDSPSWIKGKNEAVEYAKKNELNYELVWGLDYKELLKKLATSRGLILMPLARDTCPRLAIEAKILGCELVLNEYVQHKDEEWFDTKDSIITYLENRARCFWGIIEDIASKNLKITNVASSSKQRFKIIVPFYNVEKYISKCVKSVKLQNYENFDCYLIDDISSDNSHDLAHQSIDGDDRFKLIKNDNKNYALGNIAKTIDRAECSDDDIIIMLDGDDWFASTNTLSTLAEIYDSKKCLLTYGSYVYNPYGNRGIEPSEYPLEVVENNSFRKDDWRASHLRSFKYSLWKKINHDDLKDSTDNYYKVAYDQAIMLPLLELASERSRYIEDTLYVYNKSNPLSVDKTKAQEQFSIAQEIRAKVPYGRA